MSGAGSSSGNLQYACDCQKYGSTNGCNSDFCVYWVGYKQTSTQKYDWYQLSRCQGTYPAVSNKPNEPNKSKKPKQKEVDFVSPEKEKQKKEEKRREALELAHTRESYRLRRLKQSLDFERKQLIRKEYARLDQLNEAYRRQQAEERAQRRWQRLVHDMQQGRRMEQKRQVVVLG